jgi:hypothetical protein
MRNTPHTISVNGSPTVTNSDGVPEYQWFGLFDVQGIFSVLDVKELEHWQGQRVEASVRVPLGTNLHVGDRVTVEGQSYRVVTVRSSPLHLRAMVHRVE